MYKVLLVDDETLIREAISENIRWQEMGFTLLGACENGRDAMELMGREAPDLLLTDICMPYVDGIELAKYTYENFPDTKIIIISGYDEFEYAKQAVRYQVLEYILKPITAIELNEVLKKARDALDAGKARTKNLRKLRGAYVSNLPLLRGRFLNSLLNGNVRRDSLEEKMQELELKLSGNCYNTAIVEGDDLAPFLNQDVGIRDDLALFAIFNITEELIREESLGMVFQDMNEKTVIIFCGASKSELEMRIREACGKIREAVFHFIGIETTIGIGIFVDDPWNLHQSYEKTRAVMEFRFLLGGNQDLWADHLGGSQMSLPVDVSKWAGQIALAVKMGNPDEIEKTVRAFAQEIRESYSSQNRSVMYVQNLLLSVINTANLTDSNEDLIMEEEKNLINRIYTYDHLSDMAGDVIKLCVKLAELVNEQRDTYGKKQALMALDYIEQNYMHSDVSLNSVCGYLAMSTSYFSTLFKSYTGETFIEALTKKRMEKAKQLLANTSKKTYEIAGEVGYSDPHYFSVNFKKFTGKTPTEYAKENR